jgi:hypothetical protein
VDISGSTIQPSRVDSKLWVGLSSLFPPAVQCYHKPNRFDQTERPSADEKTVCGSDAARERKCQNEPWAALLEGVKQEHGGYCAQTEYGKAVQATAPPTDRRPSQGAPFGAARFGA